VASFVIGLITVAKDGEAKDVESKAIDVVSTKSFLFIFFPPKMYFFYNPYYNLFF
jgi:hypothetical protein